MGLLADLGLVAFLVLQTWLGWRSGLLGQAIALAATALGVAAGLCLAPALAERWLGGLTSDPFHARLAAFLLVAGLVALALRLVTLWLLWTSDRATAKPVREARRRRDRVLGGVFGAAKGVLLALVLVALAAGMWPHLPLWQGAYLTPPFASAGAQLLPRGAPGQVRAWVDVSAAELRRGLRLQSGVEEAPALSNRKPKDP